MALPLTWREILLTYYVIYRNDERAGGPAGLFVMDSGVGKAILWDHRAREWAVDTGLVVRFVDDYRNIDRYETVERAEAEAVAEVVTGGGRLPDEDRIHALFAAAPADGR
jgi:(2Fe-2S) ferredoxin